MVTLRFTPTVADGERLYIDIARELSVQLRKFHRQGLIYRVTGGAIHDSNQNAYVKFNTAPDTWATRVAWRRGKRYFDKQFEEILSLTPSLKPKYHDYKVFLLDNHTTSNTIRCVDSQENAGGVAGAGAPWPSGEWVYSQYISEDPDGTAPSFTTTNRNNDNFYSHIVGPSVPGGGLGDNWTRVGLISSWARSTSYPDPSGEPVIGSGVSADPLVNLFDESDADDEKVDLLNSDNDQTPYDEVYPPGEAALNLQRQAFASCSAGAGAVAYFTGFDAICGLIELDFTVSGPGIVEILLDVEPVGRKI